MSKTKVTEQSQKFLELITISVGTGKNLQSFKWRTIIIKTGRNVKCLHIKTLEALCHCSHCYWTSSLAALLHSLK